MNDLFDLAQSKIAKETGMNLAASNNKERLAKAREIAKNIAITGDGTCNMDEVNVVLSGLGIPSGNWAGSVFKEDCWVFTGSRVKSHKVSSHAREVKVWRLSI